MTAKQQNMKKSAWKSNTGAMFGLDARIALAIFAGLATVTTYTIVNVVQDTHKSTLANDLKAVAIAYENMVLSTGIDTTNFENLHKNSNNMFGWAGPYIDLDSNMHNKYGEFHLLKGKNGTSDANGKPGVCKRREPCTMWVSLDGVPSDTAYALDELLDGQPADPLNGRLRMQGAGADMTTVYYKIQPTQSRR